MVDLMVGTDPKDSWTKSRLLTPNRQQSLRQEIINQRCHYQGELARQKATIPPFSSISMYSSDSQGVKWSL